ncbi:mitochondrial splicing system protein [Umbelopsis sp. WA50703]
MKSLPAPRRAMLKKIYDPESNELLDNAIVLWFPGPHSYTGEDTVEFHIHGGNAVTRSVLEALDKLNQFRIAERGEFSRRAFDNDKLDLTELEGLADLLNAETEMQRKIALRQADGSLRHQYENWRKQLIKCMALTEAVIDFGEDENIEDNVLVDVRNIVELLRESIKAHLNDNRVGEILRDGIHITISGPPNAGKSSFLNLLARREAAIVSDIPGTTRDVVEVSLNLGGYPVVISDTAGIRASTDTIEMEGVKRAKAKILSADMHICLLPLTEVNMYLYEDDHALLTESITPDTILIINKSDIDNSSSTNTIAALSKKLGVRDTWLISCRTGQGIDTALIALNNLLKQRYESTANSSALITHSRHRSNLNVCLAALDLAAEYSQTDIVLAAEELRQAAAALGRITGKVDVEQILDLLFSEFCIGK